VLLLSSATGCGRLNQTWQNKDKSQGEVKPPAGSDDSQSTDGQSNQDNQDNQDNKDEALTELEKALNDLEKMLEDMDLTQESDYVEE